MRKLALSATICILLAFSASASVVANGSRLVKWARICKTSGGYSYVLFQAEEPNYVYFFDYDGTDYAKGKYALLLAAIAGSIKIDWYSEDTGGGCNPEPSARRAYDITLKSRDFY